MSATVPPFCPDEPNFTASEIVPPGSRVADRPEKL